MALATVVTTAGAGNYPATNELPVDMHKKTMKAFPELTPLTSIWTKLTNDGATNFRVDWIEENVMPTTLTVATDEGSAGSGSIVVTGYGDSLAVESLLFNPRTYDIQLFSSNSSNTLTTTANYAGTTAAKWLAGDTIHVLPPAIQEDDDNLLDPVSVANDNVYNYIQLVKMQFAVTRVMDKVHTHFGGAGTMRKSLKSQKYREFREKWEKLIYFGGRNSTGTAPATYRTMGGLVHYLRNGKLYKDFGGTFTESGFDNFLGDYRDENPDADKIVLACAPNVIRQIGYFSKDKIRISPNTKRYGLNITQYFNGPLDVDLVPLPLLTDSITKGWGWLLDFKRIMLKNLDNPTFYPDARPPGESEIIYDTYRVVTSMLIGNESRHAMMVGATL